MLVLARKVNEEIMIGDNVRIIVLSIKGNKVRLGFDAADGISIQRKEIYVTSKSSSGPGPVDDTADQDSDATGRD